MWGFYKYCRKRTSLALPWTPIIVKFEDNNELLKKLETRLVCVMPETQTIYTQAGKNNGELINKEEAARK